MLTWLTNSNIHITAQPNLFFFPLLLLSAIHSKYKVFKHDTWPSVLQSHISQFPSHPAIYIHLFCLSTLLLSFSPSFICSSISRCWLINRVRASRVPSPLGCSLHRQQTCLTGRKCVCVCVKKERPVRLCVWCVLCKGVCVNVGIWLWFQTCLF